MHWMKCTLTTGEVAEGALVQITNNFSILNLVGNCPPDGMLFCRPNAEGMDVFASPPAEPMLKDPTLSRFGWSCSARPGEDGLIMLAGCGDPADLFSPAAEWSNCPPPDCPGGA